MLEENSSVVKQELVILVVAIGIGHFFHPPLLCLQAAMPLKEMASSTAVFFLLRQLGGTIGISVGDTIFASEARKRLAKIPEFTSFDGGNVNTFDYTLLSKIQVREESLALQFLKF